MELSIIIVNWNCAYYLEKCLKSIYANKIEGQFEVIVIDNDSSDNSISVIKHFKKIKLIKTKKNLGFATACNQGIKLSKGKYILFLNPDTVVLKNSINLILDYLKKNKNIDAIAPKLLNEDKTPQLSMHGFATLPHIFFEISFLHKLFPKNKFFKLFFGKILSKFSKNLFANYIEYNNTTKVDFVSGACFLTKRQAIKKVGLFDENFFLYHEDMDWFYRFKNKGLTCIYYPNSEAIHYGKKCTSQIPEKIFIERCKSLKYFYKKHYKNKILFFKIISFFCIFINILLSLSIYKGKNIKKMIGSRINALKEIIL